MMHTGHTVGQSLKFPIFENGGGRRKLKNCSISATARLSFTKFGLVMQNESLNNPSRKN